MKIHQKLAFFSTKMTITGKIKIGKIWNMIFLSIMPHLSCKFDHFWIFFILMYASPCRQNTKEIVAKYAVDANLFRLGSIKPKKKSSPWIFFIEFFFSNFFQYLKKCKFEHLRNVLKQMKNQFSDFYLSSYGHFCTQNTPIFD